MGRYHAIEDALHAYWQAHYGAKLLTVQYADLVADPDAAIATLLTHTGLPDEPGVRQFHAGRRVVQTASVDQVRQPINRAGLDSAAPYRAKLAPYERAYGEARAALGLS
jgi:LPS sulfotransferase NodH